VNAIATLLSRSPVLTELIGQERALLSELAQTSRRLLSVPRVLQLARSTEVGTTPHDVVMVRGAFKLRRRCMPSRSCFATR
jgi:hypothetical protein